MRTPVAFVLGIALGSLALVLLANASALGAWFAADDFLWLEIGRLDDVLRSFVGPWGHGAAWRPLSRVSFYVDYLLFGLDAGPWHLVSLLWHATTTTLLALLLTRLTGEPTFALVAASIFALLPMHYENTLWISARSHSIALAGALASLLALDRFLQAPSAARLFASGSFLVAALLTYESAVYTVPLAVLVVLARRRSVSWQASFTGLATLAGVVAVYLIARRWVLAGENLYAVRATGSWAPAVAGRFGDLSRALIEQIWPSPWWFVAAAATAAVTSPRMLVLAATGVLVVVIGYAPFSLVDGFGPRFAYAAQAGLAMMLAAAVTGLARLPRLGRPLAALLLSLLLVHELRETRQIALEWRQAGDLGRRALERLSAAWPDPDPDRPAVILGVPVGLGRGMIFFTYFDLALAAFHPAHAGLRVPGHVLTDFPERLSHAIAVDAWRREQQRRRRRGLPELVCPGRPPDETRTVYGFVRALLDCDAVFFTFERPGLTVRQLPRAAAEARLKRGWRNPSAAEAGPPRTTPRPGRRRAPARPPGFQPWPSDSDAVEAEGTRRDRLLHVVRREGQNDPENDARIEVDDHRSPRLSRRSRRTSILRRRRGGSRKPSALGCSVGSTISRSSADASKGTIRAIGVTRSYTTTSTPARTAARYWLSRAFKLDTCTRFMTKSHHHRSPKSTRD